MCRRTLHEINLIGDGFPQKPPPLPPPASPYNSRFSYEQTSASTHHPPPYFNRSNPDLVMAMTIMAAIFFLFGLIHLLIRYLTKKPPFSPLHHSTRFSATSSSSSSSGQFQQPLQGQLHQLFRLHDDSGLDQAFIDALPVFHYKDIINMGSKEPPFDCAVCLCEFSEQDKLRLLPTCSHAFHTYCIDTWLLSNSTCPLCRGTLLSSTSSPTDNPQLFRLEDATSNNGESGSSSSSSSSARHANNGPAAETVLSVRLGKLRGLKLNETEEEDSSSSSGDHVEMEGEISSRISCNGRRCYSLGRIHEYVENETNLMVAMPVDGETWVSGSSSAAAAEGVEMEGSRKIRSGRNCKGESFSVSKIWLWSDKNKNSRFPASAMYSPTASLPFRDGVT